MINREENMQALQDELENDLEIVGCTAIEDLLQDKVGETIDFLIKANIKVWVLTGDKVETSKSIAQSCMLIRANMHEILIDGRTDIDMNQQLENGLALIKNTHSVREFYCVITGDAVLNLSSDLLKKKVYY